MPVKHIPVVIALFALLIMPCGSSAAESQSDQPGTSAKAAAAPKAAPATEAASATKAASAFLPVSTWEFEPVADGKQVVHDFVIQNKGNAPLNISRVKTG